MATPTGCGSDSRRDCMLDGGNGEKWEMETDIQRVAQETSCSQPTKDLTWQCCYCCCDARVGAWLVRTGRKGAWGEPTEQKQTDRQTDIEANGKPKIFKQPHINVEHISARKYIKDNGCTHRYFAMGSSRTAAKGQRRQWLRRWWPDEHAGGSPGGFFKARAKHPRICTDSIRIRLG